MADFVAVLKKTIDGLGGATPATRARVYDKARASIAAKLAAITPPPAPAVVERQKLALEEAIATTEADYVAAESATAEPVDDLETVMESLAAPLPQPAPKAVPVAAPIVRQPPVATPAPTPPVRANPQPATAAVPAAATAAAPATNTPEIRGPGIPANVSRPDTSQPRKSATRARNGGRIAVALIALMFAGVAAYAVWLNRDEVSDLVGIKPIASNEPEKPAAPADKIAAAPAASTPPAVQPDQPAPPKFTQRLNADGSEMDPGPAGGAAGIGEGTSVAAITPPPATAPADATPPATDPAAPADGTAAAPATPAPAQTTAQPASSVAVGQRAIFYEERTTANQGSAEQGNIVWSLVQESPGDDLPPEPAIRAEATIPGKDLQLRMTIRRNADTTLPASHIVELIFLTPENFSGGVIENVLRMTMKDTEESTGNPVLGLPAKIGDGFFLIALANSAPEVEANMQLFRRMKWIDIPIVYRSGRRALMTMERGIPGDKVFEEAIKAWAAKSG